MLKSKAKGLFIDISEFSILAVRTSGYKLPIKIEQFADFPVTGDCRPDDVRGFLEKLVDFKGSKYHIARCGVYPKDRFIHYYEAESLAKVKKQDHLQKVLQSEYEIDLAKNSVSILNANNGSDLYLSNNASKKLVFCGGPVAAFQEAQNQLLSYGIYPERLELSSITTLGGICDYIRLNQFESSVICVELTSESIYVSILNEGSVVMTRPMSFGLNSIFPVLQQELNLKDEMSARKLFYTNTFDVAEMGKRLLMPILKELQAISGYYEVQTGLTIDQIFISVLPSKLDWVTQTISDSLGLEVIRPEIEPWLESLKIAPASGVDLSDLGSRWLGIFSLMSEFQSTG